ncbi:MAG TPA: tRNA dimethylallyltransferase, partial [Campylobacterales bacterium]|nr:tRNA dimethylallyltransferase [Campylobacterales bacterium]
DRDILRERIALRTAKMFELGIVEEAEYLASRYGRDTKPIGSIGLKETLAYIDGDISRQACEELINIHTSQLAKRQSTFNKTQLSATFRGVKDDVYSELQKLF